jgi:hypothetical protein
MQVGRKVMRARMVLGGVAGGLVAGLGLSAMLVVLEKATGKPSELIELERAAAAKAGVQTGSELPGATEQAAAQGGHLLLSALAGAAYAAAVGDKAAAVPKGVAFGLAFYGAAHLVAGPALGVTTPEWQRDARTISVHVATHIAFGLVTAALTRAINRRAPVRVGGFGDREGLTA